MNTRRKTLQFYNSIWIQSKCTKCKRSSWLCLLKVVLTSVSLLQFLLISPKRILFQDKVLHFLRCYLRKVRSPPKRSMHQV